jgi:hypothetical protein
MATIPQIEANRLNAQKSTGPRSVEGKAVSCFNATKTGIDAKSQIVRGEDPADLQTLTAEYRERWQPASPEQRLLVDTLIICCLHVMGAFFVAWSTEHAPKHDTNPLPASRISWSVACEEP